MDFLDPKKKRARGVRLVIGNGLTAVAIAMATLILVYMAYGYNFDRKSGQIVQTGLMFITAQPAAADIFLNDVYKGKTNARFVLDAAVYKIKLQRQGYRNWERAVNLEGSSIERFIYPLLFPNTLVPQTIGTYPAAPALVSESLDRHWVLLAEQPTNNKFNFNLYDTTKLDTPKTVLSLPAELFTASAAAPGTLKEVEWSSDNKSLLLEHDYAGTSEFAVIDRSDPSKSYNVNKLFKLSPVKVTLHDKKTDQLYLLLAAQGQLDLATVKDHSLEPRLQNVVDFKAYGSDLLSYAASDPASTASVAIDIWDNGKVYNLTNVSPGSKYLLDIAKFQGDWFYIAGDDKQQRVEVYKNPVTDLSGGLKASKFFLLHTPAAQKTEFSTNARFVMSQAGQLVAVYDFETQRSYLYTVKEPLSGTLHWMDGHRLVGVSGGKAVVFDYDYSNFQTLVASSYEQAALFDRDYLRMMVIAPSGDKQAFQAVELRAPADIPANQKLKL